MHEINNKKCIIKTVKITKNFCYWIIFNLFSISISKICNKDKNAFCYKNFKYSSYLTSFNMIMVYPYFDTNDNIIIVMNIFTGYTVRKVSKNRLYRIYLQIDDERF